MINSFNNFFTSKKLGFLMSLLASFIALTSLLSFLPPNVHNVLRALCVGFFVMLTGFLPFLPAYSDDWNRHKPWGKEFLTKVFSMSYCFFSLIFIVVIWKDIIPLLH